MDETPSLAYGSSETGIVDLYVANKWGISCIIYTNDLEQTYGQVICSQLGLNMKGVYFEYLGNVFWEQKYWQSIFNCSGNETRLSEGNCLETEEYVDQCAQSSDTPVKLSCRPSSSKYIYKIIRIFLYSKLPLYPYSPDSKVIYLLRLYRSKFRIVWNSL